MNSLVIASHNSKKIEELKAILAPLNVKILDAAETNLQDVEETETTFVGNATLKVKSAYKQTGLPCIADDSGFCVEALKGAPGVYSARYQGGHNRVLQEISHLHQKEDRKAYFYCVISYIDIQGKQHNFEGRIDGYIPLQPSGNAGFAYDPIFIPNGFDKTFAEITPKEKHNLSHRGKALQQFIKHLEVQPTGL